MVGPFTFLKLAKYRGSKTIKDFVSSAAEAYKQILKKFNDEGVSWVQIDEPIFSYRLNKKKI